MEVAAAIEALGGVTTRAVLVAATSRRDVDAALRDGTVVRLAHNRYAMPAVEDAVARAHALGAVLCLTSAALHHGWAVKHVPERPRVSVPRNRKLASARCGELQLLRWVAGIARGAGAARVRLIAGLARAESANPFESVLRAIAVDVPGLHVEPQLTITSVSPWVRPDLVDRDLGIVLEADSFEWHGDRAALRRDARRYNLLVVDGWVVLRFAWEDVMFDPDHVRETLVSAVTLVQRRTEVACPRCRTA